MRVTRTRRPQLAARAGEAFDYVLILAATFPIVLIAVTKGKRIMQLVWEMLCVQVSWPFL